MARLMSGVEWCWAGVRVPVDGVYCLFVWRRKEKCLFSTMWTCFGDGEKASKALMLLRRYIEGSGPLGHVHPDSAESEPPSVGGRLLLDVRYGHS